MCLIHNFTAFIALKRLFFLSLLKPILPSTYSNLLGKLCVAFLCPPCHQLVLRILPERRGTPWSEAAGYVAWNSLVLILFCVLLEVARPESESESPAFVLVCSHVFGADLVLLLESPQYSGLRSSEESAVSISLVLSVGKFIGSKTGEPSSKFDTPPAVV